MNAERYQRVRQMFLAVCELEPERAAAFLEQASATQEISTNAQLMAERSRVVAANIVELNNKAAETDQGSKLVLNETERLTHHAGAMSGKVDNFLMHARAG